MRKCFTRGLAVILTGIAGLDGVSAHAALFPYKGEWRSLRTKNFEVIYASGQEKLAEVYGASAERAFQVLETVFVETPPTPIPVVISDVVDQPNGTATFLPYPMITVFPVLPATLDTVAHYENWAYEMMMHELTHIFSFTPAHGVFAPLKYVFGTVLRPAAITPRWYLEGLAVEMESRFTSQGRLRSPGTAAALRALVADNALAGETIDRINENDIPTWPYGQRPYLFGSALWHRLAEDKGIPVVEKLSQRFGRRMPFLLNQPLRDETGTDWPGYWRLLQTDLETDLKTQLESVKSRGEMDFTRVAATSAQQSAPAISPDGAKLAYFEYSPEAGASLQIIDRGTERKSFSKFSTRKVMALHAPTRIAWLPDSKSVIVDQMHLVERYFRFRDLYLVNTETGESEPLTGSERASEPVLSPGGGQVAFVRANPGFTELAVMDLASRGIRTVLSPKPGIRAAQPEFLDEKTLIFIGRTQKGADRVYKLDLKTGQRKPFNVHLRSVAALRRSPKGILVTAAHTGANNLYLYESDAVKPQAITNARAEITSGTIDIPTNELLAVHLTAQGRKLFASEFKKYDPPELGTPGPLKFTHPAPPVTRLTKASGEHRDYSPWRYLVPRYWIPFVYTIEGGVLLQGMTTMNDPTGRHTYGIDATYDSVTSQMGYGFNYLYSRRPVDTLATVAETNELLSVDSDPLTNRLQSLGFGFFLPGFSNSWRATVTGTHITTDVPRAGAPAINVKRAGPTANLTYTSAAGQLAKPSWGEFGASLSYTSWGNFDDDYLDYEKTAGSLGVKLRGPFPSRHFLSLQLRGSTAPRLNAPATFGDRTIGGNYLVSLINSNYLLRGYPSGALAGRNMLNANLEYHFPLWDIYRGSGTAPWFFQAVEMTVFADAAAVDGYYLDPEVPKYVSTSTGETFGGAGLEFTLSNTMAYHLPLTLTFGLYYGFDERAGGGFTPFLGLGYVGHGGVDDSGSYSSSPSTTTTRLRPVSFAR
jgi:hypothetical protein